MDSMEKEESAKRKEQSQTIRTNDIVPLPWDFGLLRNALPVWFIVCMVFASGNNLMRMMAIGALGAAFGIFLVCSIEGLVNIGLYEGALFCRWIPRKTALVKGLVPNTVRVAAPAFAISFAYLVLRDQMTILVSPGFALLFIISASGSTIFTFKQMLRAVTQNWHWATEFGRLDAGLDKEQHEFETSVSERMSSEKVERPSIKEMQMAYAKLVGEMGQAFLTGQGVPQDLEQGMEYLQEAADDGDAHAQAILGIVYNAGEYAVQNKQKAFDLAQKSAEQKNPEGQMLLGIMYWLGEVCQQDFERAFDLIKKAAIQDNPIAQCKLAQMFNDGQGCHQDKIKALAWAKKAATQGNISAQRFLGIQYLSGHGGADKQADAESWLRKAADQGDALAKCGLGRFYEDGDYENLKKAAMWFRKAAIENGAPEAQYSLGVMYADGRGVEKDGKKAVHWYMKAAYQGHPMAAWSLGVAELAGRGTERNLEQGLQALLLAWESGDEEVLNHAKKLAEKSKGAAVQGDNSAQCLLGFFHKHGIGVEKDVGKARMYYQEAASQGYTDAQFLLGQRYHYGDGARRDLREAHKWYRYAADKGHENAAKAMKEVEALTEAEQ